VDPPAFLVVTTPGLGPIKDSCLTGLGLTLSTGCYTEDVFIEVLSFGVVFGRKFMATRSNLQDKDRSS